MSTYKKLNRRGIHTALAALSVMASQPVWAEALNTQLPKQQEETFSVPVNVDIPAQPLANSLHDLGKATGMNISFPNDVVSGKTAPEVRGRMTRKEALQRVLGESGLVPKIEGNNIFIQKPPKDAKKDIQLDKVEVRAKRFYEIGPLPGLGLTKEEIPGNVQSISAKEIKEAHSLSLTDLMNRKLQSVTVNDYQGNPFQMDVQYRGFTAGPQIGTPQGLSVFLDGIRVNEPFGDVVNWDMIPMNALAGVDVFPGSNPIFGLNTLGGAFAMKTKDGFNNAGFDADILTGSFGRKQLQAEGGWNNGTVGLFAAANVFLEDGWRKNSPSKVNQLFAKGSYRGDKLDLNLSTLLVKTDLVGNGLIPSEEYERNRNSVFSSPDTTKNELQQFQLSGSYFVNDTFTVTGQIYRRDSQRKQIGADVFTDWGQADDGPFDRERNVSNIPYTCLFKSTNDKGLPDYYVISTTPNDNASTEFFGDPAVGNMDPAVFDSGAFPNVVKNGALLPELERAMKEQYLRLSNLNQEFLSQTNKSLTPLSGEVTTYSDGLGLGGTFTDVSYTLDAPAIFTQVGQGGVPDGQVFPFVGLSAYYYSVDPVTQAVTKNYVVPIAPINNTDCANAVASGDIPGVPYAKKDPVTGRPIRIDGALYGAPGVVEGTPTAVFTNNKITQIVNGASFQLNWNLEKHKLMVGAAIDSASADYSNSRQLGLFDANRNAFLAPDLIHPQFAAADLAVSNNNFEGTSTTKSIYFSETWKPIENWSFNASARYNDTKIKNTIATRSGFNSFDLIQVLALPNAFDICRTDDECNNYAFGYRLPDLSDVLDPPETEKFSYYSLNPSLGFTWQAKENLNVYANLAQGTRTPSVIELGCAVGKPSSSPLRDSSGNPVLNPDGTPAFIPQGVLDNRECFLPSTLSGDPYLPQIKATTYDVGIRGTWGDSFQWNLGAYQTDLKNDIYFVSVAGGGGFFDTVGDTRRRGIEAGLSGKVDKFGFRINYALTDATFEDDFLMLSADNSSSTLLNGFGDGLIRVKPGSRMPGVPLHNLNASMSYDLTDNWSVSLGAVVHSEIFVRGNENNEHRQGITQTRVFLVDDPANPGTDLPVLIQRQPTGNPGKLPGYTTFNFQTSYKFSKEWSATLLINNLFDKEYFSAGRLGRNPFSPSIQGAIGPDGYNHNSNDWLSTNFIAPGAPRGIWFSLNWHFVPD
nr:TonB-dependent receptor [Methylophilus methylotrophus]